MVGSAIFNSTLLHLAISNWKCPNSVKYLIQLGADPIKIMSNGDTPLHTAVSLNVDIQIIKDLLTTKHLFGECTKTPKGCHCGFEALKKKNLIDDFPKDQAIDKETRKLLHAQGKIINASYY